MAKKSTKRVQEPEESVPVPTSEFASEVSQFLDVMGDHHLDAGKEYRIPFYGELRPGTVTIRVDIED